MKNVYGAICKREFLNFTLKLIHIYINATIPKNIIGICKYCQINSLCTKASKKDNPIKSTTFYIFERRSYNENNCYCKSKGWCSKDYNYI